MGHLRHPSVNDIAYFYSLPFFLDSTDIGSYMMLILSFIHTEQYSPNIYHPVFKEFYFLFCITKLVPSLHAKLIHPLRP